MDNTGTIATQKCKGPCERELPLTEEWFQRHYNSKVGFLGYCRDCHRKRSIAGSEEKAQAQKEQENKDTEEPVVQITAALAEESVATNAGQQIMPGMPKPLYPIRELAGWINKRIERGSQAAVIALLELKYLMSCEHKPEGTKGHDILASDYFGRRYYIDVTTNRKEFDSKVSAMTNGTKGDYCTDVILYDLDTGRIVSTHGKVTKQILSLAEKETTS